MSGLVKLCTDLTKEMTVSNPISDIKAENKGFFILRPILSNTKTKVKEILFFDFFSAGEKGLPGAFFKGVMTGLLFFIFSSDNFLTIIVRTGRFSSCHDRISQIFFPGFYN